MLRKFSIFVVVFLFFCITITCAAKYKWKCNAQEEAEIDDLAAKMITLGRDDVKLPYKTAQIKPFCRQELQMLNRGESYKNKCMKGHQKQVFSVAIYTLKQFINQVCKRPNSKKTQSLLKAVPCINEGSKDYNKCNIKYIDLLESVQHSSDFKGQIAHLCCGYFQLFSCIREAGAKVKVCNRQTIELLLDMIRLNTENVVNMLCGDYTADSDRCDKVKLDMKPAKDPSKRSKSFVKPLITILSNEH